MLVNRALETGCAEEKSAGYKVVWVVCRSSINKR